MQPLLCEAGVLEPSPGAAAGLGRWFVGGAGCGFVDISRGGGSTRQPQRTEPCQFVSDQPWACHGPLQGQMQPLQCAAGVVEPVLGATAGMGRWIVVGLASINLPVCGDFRRRRQQQSATTAHRALPVCELPALGTHGAL